MELRQLKYFLAIAEEGQITKAAEKLHITQPPLSQQIILLENELGVQLFQRTKKQVLLTEAGRSLQNRAEQLLELLKTTVDEVHKTAEGLRGKLTLGTITSSGRSLLPESIQRYHALYPDVTFDLRQGDSRRIQELLDSGLVEIGLVRLPVDESLYNSIPLPRENMVVVSSPGAFLSPEIDEIELRQLENTPLLIHRRYAPSVSDYCRNILCISDDVTPLLIWTRLGLGVAIVPESAINLLHGSSLLVHKIIKPALVTTGAVIWRKKHKLSAAAAHFIELFQDLSDEKSFNNI
jgi:LysR family transcriptional regulator, salicylic acid-responsive activator of bsdBCD